MSHADDDALMGRAGSAREKAYAPYSGFRVGAAVRDEHGNVHTGCNVENAAYPLGTCAETAAIAAMINAGGSRIDTIAVAGGADEAGPCTPCGGCRQRIAEFGHADTRIVVLAENGERVSYAVDELLPAGFSLD
jgi:cytidine deaminase